MFITENVCPVMIVYFTDKQLEIPADTNQSKPRKDCIRARSRSMVNGVRKLTRLHSFSGTVPRYQVVILFNTPVSR